MREKWHIRAVFPGSTASKKCVADLVRICPEGNLGKCFGVGLFRDDPRLELLLQRLRADGLQADPSRNGLGYFPVGIHRHYSRKDLDDSVLLDFEPTRIATQVADISDSGQVSVSASKPKTSLNIFALDMDVTAVTQEVKEQMLAAGLQHVTFDPVLVTGKGSEEWQGKIWQLSSDLKLPKLAPKCKLVYPGRGGGPFDGDYSRWVMVEEDFYSPVLFHYRASDLVNMETFDLACPFERMTDSPHERYLIASQRFYRFCRDRGYRLSWWPVCIDPD